MTCGLNGTLNVTGEGDFTLFYFANNSQGNSNLASVNFSVALTPPSINLDTPNLLVNYTEIYLNFTALDSDGLDTCELYADFSGSFIKNYTWNPTNNTMNWTIVNLIEGSYVWGVWCNDTLNNAIFSENNTLEIDLTEPTIDFEVITTTNSQTISFFPEIEDNLDICWYSIFLDGQIDEQNLNVTFDCNTYRSARVSGFDTYELYIYANDTLGRTTTSSKSFTTSLVTFTISGGGSIPSSNFVPVIAIILPEGFRAFSPLERAIIYRVFYNLFNDVSGLSLSDVNLLEIKDLLEEDGIILDITEISMLLQQYNNNEIENIDFPSTDVDRYNLIKAILEFRGDEFGVTPRVLEPLFFIMSENSEFEYIVRSNRNLAEARLVKAELGLQINKLTNTTVSITYKPPKYPLDYGFKVISGTANYVSADGESIFQEINIRIINLRSPNLIIGTTLSVLIIALLIIYRKKVSKFFKWKKYS